MLILLITPVEKSIKNVQPKAVNYKKQEAGEYFLSKSLLAALFLVNEINGLS